MMFAGVIAFQSVIFFLLAHSLNFFSRAAYVRCV